MPPTPHAFIPTLLSMVQMATPCKKTCITAAAVMEVLHAVCGPTRFRLRRVPSALLLLEGNAGGHSDTSNKVLLDHTGSWQHSGVSVLLGM